MKLFLVFLLLLTVLSYKPVIYFHGLFGSPNNFELIQKIILERDPKTKTFSIDIYSRVNTLIPLFRQAQGVMDEINRLKRVHNFDEYNLVCSSQGGLVCRMLIMLQQNHGVDTFMTLATPNMGVYGIPDIALLRQLLGNVTRDNAHFLLYTKVAQERISFSNYWNDPKQRRDYLTKNTFLPFANNEMNHPRLQDYKRNFLKIKRLVSFGSEADEVLSPWSSSIYSYYSQDLKIVSMKEQEVYTRDLYGLQTLDKENRLFIHVEPKMGHWDWVKKEDVIRKYLKYFN